MPKLLFYTAHLDNTSSCKTAAMNNKIFTQTLFSMNCSLLPAFYVVIAQCKVHHDIIGSTFHIWINRAVGAEGTMFYLQVESRSFCYCY